MLHADKGAFLSSVQRDAVQLHKQELEYFMLRYVALATVSSILVGFCWMGLIKSGELFRPACSSVADDDPSVVRDELFDLANLPGVHESAKRRRVRAHVGEERIAELDDERRRVDVRDRSSRRHRSCLVFLLAPLSRSRGRENARGGGGGRGRRPLSHASRARASDVARRDGESRRPSPVVAEFEF